ncbi:uncharacterized protein LOC129730754 [Wyeomyia smithii]|uniref:uncharacterized protein LOC129730754 n=1 Tax=Wyeomyia smithii TaxID=174621 RepID=UPI002467FB00|nr:uncharacterized protein LOC129730754 [Wyeomyia smithii]
MIPKKFYRYVLKGVHFNCERNKRGCSLDELVAYVHLKNQQSNRVETVEDFVGKITTKLLKKRVLLKTPYGSVKLSQLLPTNASDPMDNDDALEETSSSTFSSVSSSSRIQSHYTTAGFSGRPDKSEKYDIDPGRQRRSHSPSSSEDEAPPLKLANRRGSLQPLPKRREH